MDRVILICAFFAFTFAAVIPENKEAQIVKYESSNDGLGNYKFSYETSNGLTREETGYLVNAGKEDEHMEVQGSYSYPDVEGKLVVVTYSAGANGYQVNAPPGSPAVPQVAYGGAIPSSVVASLLGK